MTEKTTTKEKTDKKKLSNVMKADVYNTKGKKAGSVDLPEKVFSTSWNADLVHQVVTGMQANKRTPIAHTKDRGEQRGGGRKPWRQKGTGRARHGSRRSPIWRGGGVTHGPRNEKSYEKKINKKMRTRALYTVLSQKYNDGEVLFVDTISFEEPKTVVAREILTHLSSIKGFEDLTSKKKNAALIVQPTNDKITKKSFANIGTIAIDETRNLNPLDVLTYKYLIIASPTESIEQISNRLA